MVAEYVGAAHAVATVNGTAALHIALLVAGVQPGDEVLVPTLTFIAPVNAIRYCQAHPVFVDADPATWQLDVEKAARFLSQRCKRRAGGCYNRRSGRRIRAILPVHLLGLACPMERLMGLAQEHGLRIIEDAAEAMGVRVHGRHAGTFGDIGVLSFNGNKIITAGGGGMLVTKQRDLAERARHLTTQAQDDPAEYVHQEIGYNYRLTNIQAALGAAQLEQLDGFIERKRAIAAAYAEVLRGVAGVTLMPAMDEAQPTYWLYTILLRAGTTREARQAVIRRLAQQGISARALWHPIHQLPPYEGCETVEIEHAARLHERGVSLPSSVGLTIEEVRRCAGRVIDALEAEEA
jgi:perosamine synthetase